jgi:2-polyprenyl-3-methyl-5-hydroxy-6-metoxy-1,4-benzoquinol methylase
MKKDAPHPQDLPHEPSRRVGDTVAIEGNYQWLAANSKNLVQRFWHGTKQSAIDALCPLKKNSVVLDVGCGSGVISSFLATQYQAKVIGVDGNPRAIAFASTQFPQAQFECRLVDDEFNTAQQVDGIYCLELIEHIYENQAVVLLNNFYRLLKPGGQIFLTTPNYKSLWPAIEWLMDFLNLAPNLGQEQHVTFYNPKRLKNLVEQCGFEVRLVRSNCFLAPWLAPFSYKLATWLDQKEIKMKWLMGSIIVLVAQKPG